MKIKGKWITASMVLLGVSFPIFTLQITWIDNTFNIKPRPVVIRIVNRHVVELDESPADTIIIYDNPEPESQPDERGNVDNGQEPGKQDDPQTSTNIALINNETIVDQINKIDKWTPGYMDQLIKQYFINANVPVTVRVSGSLIKGKPGNPLTIKEYLRNIVVRKDRIIKLEIIDTTRNNKGRISQISIREYRY